MTLIFDDLQSAASSNRTFMELKYPNREDNLQSVDSSNRTFMELKSHPRDRFLFS